jgi:DNA-binding FadR family transcriptional regulator
MNKASTLVSPHIDLDSDLLNYIIEKGFQPGDRLPSIHELQETNHLGISASKIREQLEVARALGLVEVRSKTGTRLQTYDFAPAVRLSLLFALATDLHHFEQFSALRTHLEVAFWNEACKLLTADDLGEMRGYVEAARAKLNDRWIHIPYQEHRAFHMSVFKRLDNPFVKGLLEAYWDAYEAVEVNRYADYAYLQNVWDYHERILSAICDGNFEAAKTAFIEHTYLLHYQPATDQRKENE